MFTKHFIEANLFTCFFLLSSFNFLRSISIRALVCSSVLIFSRLETKLPHRTPKRIAPSIDTYV